MSIDKTKKTDQNLYSVMYVEPFSSIAYKKIPREYIYRRMAEQFIDPILENMEISSSIDPEDPYAQRFFAKVFIVKPSKVFSYHLIEPDQEVVVLDYKGFIKRFVVHRHKYDVEMFDPEPFKVQNLEEGKNFNIISEIMPTRLRFVDNGRRNEIGERIFEYVSSNK